MVAGVSIVGVRGVVGVVGTGVLVLIMRIACGLIRSLFRLACGNDGGDGHSYHDASIGTHIKSRRSWFLRGGGRELACLFEGVVLTIFILCMVNRYKNDDVRALYRSPIAGCRAISLGVGCFLCDAKNSFSQALSSLRSASAMLALHV